MDGQILLRGNSEHALFAYQENMSIEETVLFDPQSLCLVMFDDATLSAFGMGYSCVFQPQLNLIRIVLGSSAQLIT